MSICAKGLNVIYNSDSVYEMKALCDLSFSIEKGEFIGIIGATGSGKSTLAQVLNGLIPLSSGELEVGGIDLSGAKEALTLLRQKVGLVFQYPEYQLFEETVAKDVAFGPRNLGIEGSELDELVDEALLAVGYEPSEIREKSPFELSGGQKRRVAIAGVIAMRPEVLILDEPSSGLDPIARQDMMDLIVRSHKDSGRITIMISHDMNQIARIADRIMLISKGKIEMFDKPGVVFSEQERLLKLGLDVPDFSKLSYLLNTRGFEIGSGIFDEDEYVDELVRALGASCPSRLDS